MRLLKLSPKVQSYLASGQISPRHGRCLVGLSQKDQGRVLDEILDNNLNVSDTEKIVKDVAGYFENKKEQDKAEKTKRAVSRIPKDMFKIFRLKTLINFPVPVL